MPNTHVQVAVRSCRLCASVWPCKSQQSIVGQSALVICRRMQRITLFTFRLNWIWVSWFWREIWYCLFCWSLLKTWFILIATMIPITTLLAQHQQRETTRTFCVPAKSASFEWVFSKSGILMSRLWSRISSKTLEMRTFLKGNYGFVDSAAPVAKTVEISSKQ